MKTYYCLVISIVMVASTMTLGLNSYAASVSVVKVNKPVPLATEEWIFDQKLLASDGAADDWFGFSIDIDRNHAIIGARWDDVNGVVNAGSANIFAFDGKRWLEEAKLVASNGTEGDWFGHSVSISGDSAFISAGNDFPEGAASNSVYVFNHDGTAWVEAQKLIIQIDGGEPDIGFGWSVCVDGEYALIGAPNDDDCGYGSGSAFAFHYDGVQWSQVQKLLVTDGKVEGFFGYSISLDGDTAIIGARCDENKGAAYIFKLEGTTWVETQKLVPGTAGTFGKAVYLNGEYAIVGAPYDDEWGDDFGAAYIFKFDGNSWIQQAKIFPSDGSPEDEFGDAVYINEEYALIGMQFDDDQGMYSGSAYLFKHEGTEWVEQVKLVPPDGGLWQQFGNAVFMKDDAAFICSLYDDENGQYSGSTYMYKRVVKVPDLECTGGLSWDQIEPKETVNGAFMVENVGDDGSLLTWRIQSYPDWGTWTFSPDSGSDLPTVEGTMVTVTVVAPDEKNTRFSGNVTIVNIDDPSDYCIISVYMKTPLRYNVPFQWFFERLFEQFPHALPMLRHQLGY